MQVNNRQQAYKPKVFEERKVRSRVKKDGKYIFVDGVPKDPYKDIPCSSLKLSSRISDGTFVDHPGSLHHLEKVNGSDVMERELARSKSDYDVKVDEQQKIIARESLKKDIEKYEKKLSENKKNSVVKVED